MSDTIRNATNNLSLWSLSGGARRLVPQFVRDLLVSAASWVGPSFSTLTDGATITWDTGGYPTNHAVVTLGGNRTLSITNLVPGATGILIIKQDATGSRTLTLPSGSKIAGGSMGLSVASGAIDYGAFVYDGTNFWWVFNKLALVGAGPISTALDPATVGSHLTLSGGNLIATSTGAGDTGVRGNTGHTSGKWYFEMNFIAGDTGGDTGAGLALSSAGYSGLGGTASSGTMVYHNGNIWVNGNFSGINIGTLEGFTLGVAVDLDNKRVWYRKGASGPWNGNATYDPVANTGGRDISSLVGALFPVLVLTGNTESITANFSGPFVGTPPAGFY